MIKKRSRFVIDKIFTASGWIIEKSNFEVLYKSTLVITPTCIEEYQNKDPANTQSFALGNMNGSFENDNNADAAVRRTNNLDDKVRILDCETFQNTNNEHKILKIPIPNKKKPSGSLILVILILTMVPRTKM